MLIFLYGPDEYRRRKKARELMRAFEEKRGATGLARFDLEEEGALASFLEFATQRSMFDMNRFGIAHNAFEAPPKELEPALRAILGLKDITVLVDSHGKPPKPFEFLIRKPALSQEFASLEGREWHGFILQEAKELGVELTERALAFLAARYRGDSWRLRTELEKASVSGENPVDAAQLQEFSMELPLNFWELTGGIISGTVGSRLAALERGFSANEPAQKLFYMLAYRSPKTLAFFSGYDRAIKSGKLDYQEALVDFVLRA